MLRRTALILAALLIAHGVAPAVAESTTELLTRADQAFGAADYKTAVAMYQKLEPQLTDADQKAAMQERLRYANKQLTSPPPAVDPAAVAALPPTGPANAAGITPSTQPTAAGLRKPHVRPAPGQTLNLTLHELGNFDYNEDDDKTIPPDVRQLDGVKVKIDGVMLPLDQAGRVTRFMLVNDMMSCCYGTAPKIQNVALVEMPKDKWMAATTDRISIEGTLKVAVKRDDGFVMNIFSIEPSSIKFAAQ